jgi:hypothetical protein
VNLGIWYGSSVGRTGRWITGSISGGTPGAQYWIRCMDTGGPAFTDTQSGLGYGSVPSARYLDGNGNGSWGATICFNAASTTVRVWTSAGQDTTVGPI